MDIEFMFRVSMLAWTFFAVCVWAHLACHGVSMIFRAVKDRDRKELSEGIGLIVFVAMSASVWRW